MAFIFSNRMIKKGINMKYNLKYPTLFLFLFLSISSIMAQVDYIEKRNNVGDIPFNPDTDDSSFELIDENNILPYNMVCGFLIEGEKYRVVDYFNEKFKSDTIIGANGYITIRFIVNYKGKTDRFRVYEMDNEYRQIKFPENITQSLLELTKKIDRWITSLDYKLDRYNCIEIMDNGNKKYLYDYYQYILFKIKDGQIETILP